MDNVTFDPHGLFRHGLTYTTLSRIHMKENHTMCLDLVFLTKMHKIL
jgi:hypothetical protein